MRFEELAAVLASVEKPMRYVGCEWNSVRKTPSSVRLRMAFAFPEVYEIGMSHQGLQILYRLVNALPGLAMERVFCPWTDMEERLRESSLPLYTLESRTPLREFDVVGFSLQYELTYTNVLAMLELGGIPLRSAERRQADPIVIAGGPAAANPEPMAAFIDAFLLGDGEGLLPEALVHLKGMKEKGVSREDAVRSLSELPGVYVPSLYDAVPDPASGFVVPSARPPAPSFIRMRKVLSLDAYPFPPDPVVPSTGIIHDRYAVEIARGCNCGCRFCQAGSVYRPERFRSAGSILQSVRASIRLAGFDEVSLTSLSTGDYPGIEHLVSDLMETLYPKRISLSLSSLRPATLTESIVREIRKVRKTGFTLAPEAATERLRKVINKSSTAGDILRAAGLAASEGWGSLKLYFMIGLPTETMQDVEAIPDLAFTVLQECRKQGGRPVNLNLSVSSFIPKPHTPFQWERMDSMEALREKQKTIRARLRSRMIQFKWHQVEASFLEAVFSRGDRRLGPVLEKAFRDGCRFDGWTEKLDFGRWMRAFEAAGVSPDAYVGRALDPGWKLPWEHVGTGVEPRHLEHERRLALEAVPSARCDYEGCLGCGACKPEFIEKEASARRTAASSPAARESSLPKPAEVSASFRYRCVYSKKGALKYLSHLDLAGVFRRALLRAGIPVVYSGGFHPTPKISFGPALPLGMEGEREVLEFLSSVRLEPAAARDALNQVLPEGAAVLEMRLKGPGRSTLSSDLVSARYTLSLEALEQAGELPPGLLKGDTGRFHRESIERFLSQSRCLVRAAKKGKEAQEIDVKPYVRELRLDPGGAELHLEVAFAGGGSARAVDVVKAVYGVEISPFALRRTALVTREDGR